MPNYYANVGEGPTLHWAEQKTSFEQYLENEKAQLGIRQQQMQLAGTDPITRLRITEAETQLTAANAHLRELDAMSQDRLNEMRAWNEDAPVLSQYRSMTPEQRRAALPPILKSKQAGQQLEKIIEFDWGYELKKESNDIARKRAEFDVKAESRKIDRLAKLSDAIGACDEANQDAIAYNGWLRDEDGNRIGLNERGYSILNTDRKVKGLQPYGETRSTTVTPSSEDLEVKELNGRKYIQVGNNNPIWLDALTPAQKIMANTASAELRSANAALNKAITDGDAQAQELALTAKSRANKNLAKALGTQLLPTAPAGTNAPASSDPLGLFK